MMSWMNSGPGELDLASPLLAGMKQGTAMAEQQERVRSDYANEAQMTAALGLQEKKESFDESMWNSQAGMRSAQLDLTKDQAQESAQRLGNVVSDKTAVDAWMHTVNAKVGAGDVQGALDTPMPTVYTPDAFSSMVNTRTSLAATGAGAAVEQKKQSILSANAALTKTHADLIGEASGAGIDPSRYAVPDPSTGKQAVGADGLPVYDYPSMAKATVQAGVAVKGQEAQQSASYLAAQMRAQASMYTANTRANASETTNMNTVEGRTLSRLYQSRDDAMKNGDDTKYWDDQINALGGKTGQPTAPPSSSTPTNPAQAVQSLFQGLPSGAPVTPTPATSSPTPSAVPSSASTMSPPRLSASTWQTVTAPASDPFNP
jgi:hypothetical protein